MFILGLIVGLVTGSVFGFICYALVAVNDREG